ncbi:MAG TPA: hypothetical protein PJ997_00250 [Candidatus Paceibacterota bacterium]|nr:hypothetical protein [Candidatus Paceibacterota bacterium]HMP18762.1 hypothetical protein [Candidatus Paceibacterota bacterium]HMP85323.1 hypothetical protein [Candidatus Paceibacterota bacterium]
MNKKTSFSILAAIVLFFLASSIYVYYKNNKTEQYSNDRQKAIEDLIQTPSETLNIKQQYKNGKYTVAGSFEVPNPCYLHNVEVIKKDNLTEIAITYSQPDSDNVCIQVIDSRNFKISFDGDLDENIIATINNQIVRLNVFEIGEDENINEVDIYIKG